MTLELGADGLTTLSIPEPQRLVVASRDGACAVGLKATLVTEYLWPWRGRIGWLLLASQSRSVLSRLPQDDARAVSAEGHAIHPILMALKRVAERLAALGIPEPPPLA